MACDKCVESGIDIRGKCMPSLHQKDDKLKPEPFVIEGDPAKLLQTVPPPKSC